MRKLFSLFAALTLSVGLWAANSVITFTSTSNLYPVDIDELWEDAMMGDGAKWAAFKAQYPEFANLQNPFELNMMGFSSFNPNAFLDANGQVLNYTYNYDDATKTGTITFAGELVTIKGYNTFSGGSSLTSITLPEGLTDIGNYVFSGCSSLASVTLPESLTTIGDLAFNNCQSLTSITISANVTEIRDMAFVDCSGLTDVYVAWTTMLPTLGGGVFGGTPVSTATLHVPAGSLALYQNADQWKDFGSIVDVPQEVKDAAIAAVNAEIEETDNENVKAIATNATTAINAATTVAEINALKTLAIAAITSAKAAYTEGETAGYNTGYDEGEAAVRAELPTEGYDGPAVIITKGEKVLTLFNPEKVEYKILEAD